MPATKDASPLLIRVVTANVQSFPLHAITERQAYCDLRRDAAAGDLVFLQEIADRYRPLVSDAFPSSDWGVFYGSKDNKSPIAFRKDVFSWVDGGVKIVHHARTGSHARRYTTHVQLSVDTAGTDIHATNVHLVPGAFNAIEEADQDERLDEWNDGIARHIRLIRDLVRTGLPVVGGGDYNRQLKKGKSLGSEIDDKRITYAVGKGSVDLLWFINGDEASWHVESTRLYPGRESETPERYSDHGARRANVTLTVARKPSPGEPHVPGPSKPMPDAFERTTFGDKSPKTVDWKTRTALEEAERRLGYRLTVVQGSYNKGVGPSAGTHDFGGVVDLLSWDWQHKVKVLRAIGFAAWFRPAIPGLWGAHIHAVMVDHGNLAPTAKNQVTAYRAGRDGLKSNNPDTFWRPNPIPVFKYPPKKDPTPPTPKPTDPAPGPAPGPAPHTPYPPKRTLDGVDTSHFQGGRIDVKTAQRAGLRWWYLKATEGTTIVDATYKKRVRQARAAGIPVGAYHFARPDGGDGDDEARFFLANADIRAGDMLPMLDLESTEGMSPAELTTWTGAWVAEVRKQLGARGLVAKPIIYTPFSLGKGFGCLLWVARYSDDFRAPNIPRPWKQAAIWQHSNGRFGPVKNVPGFGPVDVNAVHPDVPMSALQVRLASPPPGPSGPTGPTKQPPSGGIRAVRTDLNSAATSIDRALERLPER